MSNMNNVNNSVTEKKYKLGNNNSKNTSQFTINCEEQRYPSGQPDPSGQPVVNNEIPHQKHYVNNDQFFNEAKELVINEKSKEALVDQRSEHENNMKAIRNLSVSITKNIDAPPLEHFLHEIHLSYLREEHCHVTQKIPELQNKCIEITRKNEELANAICELKQSHGNLLAESVSQKDQLNTLCSNITLLSDKIEKKILELRERKLEYDKATDSPSLGINEYVQGMPNSNSPCSKKDILNSMHILISSIESDKQEHKEYVDFCNELVDDYNTKLGELSDLNSMIIDKKHNLDASNLEHMAIKCDLKMMESIKINLDALKNGEEFSSEKVLEKYPKLNAGSLFNTLLYDFDSELNIDHPIIEKIKSELQTLRLFVCDEGLHIDLIKVKAEIEKYPNLYKNLNKLIPSVHFPVAADGELKDESRYDYATKKQGDSLPYPSIRSYYMAYTFFKNGQNSNNTNGFMKLILGNEHELFVELEGNKYIFVEEGGEELDNNVAKNSPCNHYKLCAPDNNTRNEWGNVENSEILENIADVSIGGIAKKIAVQMDRYISCIDDNNVLKLIDSLCKEVSKNSVDDEIKNGLNTLSSLLDPLNDLFEELLQKLSNENVDNRRAIHKNVAEFLNFDDNDEILYLILLSCANPKEDEVDFKNKIVDNISLFKGGLESTDNLSNFFYEKISACFNGNISLKTIPEEFFEKYPRESLLLILGQYYLNALSQQQEDDEEINNNAG